MSTEVYSGASAADIKIMVEEIKNLHAASEKIRMKYQGKMAEMTGQEETEWQNMLARADMLGGRVEGLKKHDRIDKWADEPVDATPLRMGGGSPAPVARATVDDRQSMTKNIRGAWKKFVKGGIMVLTPEEIKAYQADNPVGGGFLVAPQDFVQELITLVKDQLFMRQLSRVFTVNHAESLGLPALDTDPTDSDWTSELLTGSEETTMAFGKRELRPHPVAKNVKVSNKLLRQAAMDPEAIVMDRLAYKLAVTQEKAFLLGSGADQPLGVFTASSMGIDTSRDVTAATTTAIAADDLISTKYKLKSQYQNKAQWILHRDVVQATRKLKDSNNNYLWTTSGAFQGATGPGNGLQGTPEMLLNMPINMSEYAPNTFTTALYMAILGDFSRYVIADALDMQLQVLDQLYAATNQTGLTESMPHSSEIWN